MNSPSRIDTTTALRVGSSKARFTAAEFLWMCETGALANMQIELVDGELERMTPPMSAHGGRQARAMLRLAPAVGEERLIGEVGIVLDDDTVLSCGLAVLRAPVTENRMLVPEDIALVIEIAETTVARDMGMKRIKYAAAGIAEYWVIDGERAVIHVFAEPVSGDYAAISTVRFGAPLAVPGSGRTITID